MGASRKGCGRNDHRGTWWVALIIEIVALVAVLIVLPKAMPLFIDACKEGLASLASQGSVSGIEAALIAALGSVIVAWPVARHVAHKAERKQYQYQRSARTTSERFAREMQCIDGLSSALYVYCDCAIRKHESQCFAGTAEREVKVKELLSESALFLDYRDSEGNAYCGVRKAQRCAQGLPADSEKAKREPMFIPAGDSAKAKLLTLSSADSMTLHTRALEVYLLAKLVLADAVTADDLNADESAGCKTLPEHIEDRYRHYLHCANCRIKSIETGTRDTRRINFKQSLPMHRLMNRFGSHYDSICTYGRGCEHPKVRWKNK